MNINVAKKEQIVEKHADFTYNYSYVSNKFEILLNDKKFIYGIAPMEEIVKAITSACSIAYEQGYEDSKIGAGESHVIYSN